MHNLLTHAQMFCLAAVGKVVVYLSSRWPALLTPYVIARQITSVFPNGSMIQLSPTQQGTNGHIVASFHSSIYRYCLHELGPPIIASVKASALLYQLISFVQKLVIFKASEE